MKGRRPPPRHSECSVAAGEGRLHSEPPLEAQLAGNKATRRACKLLREEKQINANGRIGESSHQGEALGGRRPPLDCGEGPLLDHVFGPLVHSHHRLFGDAQETRNQLVFALHLFL